MRNLEISLPLVDGGLFPLEYSSGKELIHEMVSDDWGAPPRCMVIRSKTADGQTVEISIPYDETGAASAIIRDNEDQ